MVGAGWTAYTDDLACAGGRQGLNEDASDIPGGAYDEALLLTRVACGLDGHGTDDAGERRGGALCETPVLGHEANPRLRGAAIGRERPESLSPEHRTKHPVSRLQVGDALAHRVDHPSKVLARHSGFLERRPRTDRDSSKGRPFRQVDIVAVQGGRIAADTNLSTRWRRGGNFNPTKGLSRRPDSGSLRPTERFHARRK